MTFTAATLFLLTCSLWGHGQSPPYTKFEKDDRYGLVDSLGKIIVPAVYDDLGWTDHSASESNVLGYQEDHLWGLMASNGKRITKPAYYGVYPFDTDGLYKVGVTGAFTNDLRFGLVDEKGRLVLSCHYFSLHCAGEDIIASIYRNHQVRYGVMGANMESKIPINYLEIKKLGGLFLARQEDGRWAFFKEDGRLATPYLFDSFWPWRDHLVVERNGARGLMDWHTGQLVLPPKFKEIHYTDTLTGQLPPTWSVYDRELKFVMEVEGDSVAQLGELLVVYLNGDQRLFADSVELLPDVDFEVKYSGEGKTIAKRLRDDRWLALNRAEVLFEADSIHFDGSYFYAREDDSWDIYNQFHRKINAYPLQAVSSAVEMYTPVKRTGQWGMLDFQGETVIGFAYDSLSTGVGLTFPAKYVGSWGVLDVFGEWVISPSYDQLVQISDLYVGTSRGVSHVLTASGRRTYQSRDSLSQGNASIVINGQGLKGLISREGEVIFDPIYDEVAHKGNYFVGHLEEGVVVKDGTGEMIVPLDQEVQDVAGESEGYIHIVKRGLHGFVDLEGRLRIANRYDSARIFCEGMAAIKLIGKWGFINIDERLVIQPFYASVSDFSNGLAIVSNGMYGLIDKQGKHRFELEYSK
ncbi:MAG: WG repeat-containing protein, partial [Bacteroidota bacterium]